VKGMRKKSNRRAGDLAPLSHGGSAPSYILPRPYYIPPYSAMDDLTVRAAHVFPSSQNRHGF
jgi:hypothetical protein